MEKSGVVIVVILILSAAILISGFENKITGQATAPSVESGGPISVKGVIEKQSTSGTAPHRTKTIEFKDSRKKVRIPEEVGGLFIEEYEIGKTVTFTNVKIISANEYEVLQSSGKLYDSTPPTVTIVSVPARTDISASLRGY